MRDPTEAIEHNLCKLCAGEGERYGERCWPCRGSGWIKKSYCTMQSNGINNLKQNSPVEYKPRLSFGKGKIKNAKIDL